MAVRRVSDGGVLRLLRTRALSRRLGFDRVLGEVRFAFELVAPTSVVVQGTGSSASVVGAGSVDFASATSLSLNGVFSAEYDNYMIVWRAVLASGNSWFTFRLRGTGTDAQGSNYTYQELNLDNTTINAARSSSQTSALLGYLPDAQRSGVTAYIYGPNLAQPTAGRVVSVSGQSNARILDHALTHSLSTAYDGFTLATGSSSATGIITVYGLRG